MREQKLEVLLNGGLNTKDHEEAADPPDFFELDGFHFDQNGRLARVPQNGAAIGIDDIDTSNWDEGETPLTLFSREGEACFVSTHHGVGRIVDGEADYLWGNVDRGATSTLDGILQAAPTVSEVSSRVLHSTQFSRRSQGVLYATGAPTAGGNFVTAHVEKGVSGSDRLYMQAHMASGDARSTQRISLASEYFTLAGTLHYIGACSYPGGAIVTYASSSGAGPYTIRAYQWSDATRRWSNAPTVLTTLSQNLAHTVQATGDGTGFYLVFTDNASGFMRVQTRTLSAVSATHTATHGAIGPAVIVEGTGASAVFSLESISTVRGEYLGTPGSVVTVASAGTGETFFGVTAARNHSTSAVNQATVFVTVSDTVVSGATTSMTEVYCVDFDSGGSITVQSSADIPNAYPCAGAVSVGNRAYVPLSIENSDGFTSMSSCILARSTLSTLDAVRMDPVARVTHDRLVSFTLLFFVTAGAWVVGNTLHLITMGDLSADKSTTYTERLAQSVFYSQIALQSDAKPLGFVEESGNALISAGVLWDYDGARVTEAQSLRRPKIHYTGTSGSLIVRAIYTWVDAQGKLHRSAPSAAIDDFTAGGTIYVEKPALTALDGSTAPEISVELYVSTGSGTQLYLANTASGYRDDYDSVSANGMFWVFTSVQTGSTADPPLYTNGGELESEAPPSFYGAPAKVGDRLVAINAENRAEWWCTKPLVEGFAPEWSSFLNGVIPDEIEAICDMNGTPTLLARGGVWQLHGAGPNAFGGSFAPPRKVAKVGCVSRSSVVETKYGMVFQTQRGYVLLDNGLQVQEIGRPVETLLNARVHSPNRVVYDPLEDELRIVAPPDQWYFSFINGKWSRNGQKGGFFRDLLSLPDGVSGQTMLEARGINLYFESATASDDSTEWETRWFKLDGIEGFGRLWQTNIAFRTPSEALSSSFNLEIEMYVDFDDSSVSTEWLFTQAKTASWSQNAVEEVELRPKRERVKAVKFRVRTYGSLSHSGLVPLAIRFRYGVRDKGGKNPRTQNHTGPLVAA